MARLTRRKFLGGASAVAAGAAVGPWVLRAHAQGAPIKIGVVLPYTGVYAVLGETDKAMAWLERSADTGFPCWPFFRIDPHLEHLRQEPAFIRLVAGLEQTYTAFKIQRL